MSSWAFGTNLKNKNWLCRLMFRFFHGTPEWSAVSAWGFNSITLTGENKTDFMHRKTQLYIPFIQACRDITWSTSGLNHQAPFIGNSLGGEEPQVDFWSFLCFFFVFLHYSELLSTFSYFWLSQMSWELDSGGILRLYQSFKLCHVSLHLHKRLRNQCIVEKLGFYSSSKGEHAWGECGISQ